jgi:hypothetical protein
LSDFPNTLFEAFPIAFRYGESMTHKRIFLCSVDTPDPDYAMAQTQAGRPELAIKLRHLEHFVAAAAGLGVARSANQSKNFPPDMLPSEIWWRPNP